MKKRETYKKYFDQIAKFFATVDIANDNFAEKNSVMIGVQKIDAWGNIDISTGESMFNAYNAVHLEVKFEDGMMSRMRFPMEKVIDADDMSSFVIGMITDLVQKHGAEMKKQNSMVLNVDLSEIIDDVTDEMLAKIAEHIIAKRPFGNCAAKAVAVSNEKGIFRVSFITEDGKNLSIYDYQKYGSRLSVIKEGK